MSVTRHLLAFRVTVALATTALKIAGGSATCNAEELPVEVVTVLERNAAALDTLSVKWEVHRRTDRGRSELLASLGLSEARQDFFETERWRYVWEHGKYYVSRKYSQAVMNLDGKLKGLRDATQEFSFDLTTAYGGNGEFPPSGVKQYNAVNFIDHADEWIEEAPSRRVVDGWYMYESGYYFPVTRSDHRDPQSSHVLKLISLGAEVTSIDPVTVGSADCIRVELHTPQRSYRFVLDRELGYAVRRREELTDTGQLALATENENFDQFSDTDVWLPRQIILRYYAWPWLRSLSPVDVPNSTFSQTELFEEEYRVTALSADPGPPDQFAIRYSTPGTTVSDATLPEAKNHSAGRITYVIPARAEDLDAAIELAAAAEPHRNLGQSAPASFRALLLTFNVALILAAVGVLVWMRRRKNVHRN